MLPATLLLSLAWITTTLVSPISWEHHYAPGLFALATIYVISRERGFSVGFGVAAAAAFALMAGYFEVRGLQGAGPRLLASYVFAAGILLMAVCVAALRPAGERPPVPRGTA